MKFRDRMARFMAGRYGVDQLNRAFFWIYLACVILALFFWPFNIVALALVVWLFFRMLSKNIYKRQAENQKYLRLTGKITGWFLLRKKMFSERKTHRYRKCPHCRAVVRLPYRKGRHTVCCPKCRQDFNVRI